MTWSIVAHDPATGAFAVAVTTCAFAVGASCPFVRAGVGAVSTQSMTNRYLGPAVLDGLQRGLSPTAAIESALAGDEGRGHPPDPCGGPAWPQRRLDRAELRRVVRRPRRPGLLRRRQHAGRRSGAGRYRRRLRHPRLPAPAGAALAALEAGDAVGGDKRGRQSAALLLTTTEDFPDINLRVDDHVEPLAELNRLLGIWRREREPGLRDQPRRANPSGWTDLDAIEAGWRRKGLSLRFRR